MNAKIHASVAVGERRPVSSVAQATSTQKPYAPVIDHGRLYGRGGADDGYAIYAALAAIAALDAEGVPRGRCVGLIETCEESGSYDLPAYLAALAPRLGEVGVVVALDSGAGD